MKILLHLSNFLTLITTHYEAINNATTQQRNNATTQQRNNATTQPKKTIHFKFFHWFTAFLMFAFFLSCSNEKEPIPSMVLEADFREGQELCDVTNQVNCDSFFRDTVIDISGCLIPVEYVLIYCPLGIAGPGGTLKIGEFDFDLDSIPNTIDCDSLDTWVDLWAIGSNTAAETAIINFYKNLTIAIEETEVENFMNLYPGNYDCNSPHANYTVTADFVLKECKTLCGEYNEEEEQWNLRIVGCGEYCCVRTYRYCIENGVLTKRIIDFGPPPTSDCNEYPTIDCNGQARPCKESCTWLK